MITATIEERKVVKGVSTIKRGIRVYTSMDKALKELKPIAQEMARCERLKIKPKSLSMESLMTLTRKKDY